MSTPENTQKSQEPTSVGEKTTNSNSISDSLLEEREINEIFVARRLDDVWYVTLGKERAPETFKSFEECKKYAEYPTWETITWIISYSIRNAKELFNLNIS